MLPRVLKTSVESGLFCAIAAITVLVLFVVFEGDSMHLIVCLWLTKVYSNSIMLILNSRARIGHGTEANHAMLATSISSGSTGSRRTMHGNSILPIQFKVHSMDAEQALQPVKL
ncbi:hypothetical protein MKEN_00610700 [Mycena kentingensis (nom. inval.)]|nr:hypothetical protein MKEN_00610700 [Mycena kentingensis (nom. inval.)]